MALYEHAFPSTRPFLDVRAAALSAAYVRRTCTPEVAFSVRQALRRKHAEPGSAAKCGRRKHTFFNSAITDSLEFGAPKQTLVMMKYMTGVIAILTAIASSSVAAETYRCMSEGRVNFQDRPCDGSAPKEAPSVKAPAPNPLLEKNGRPLPAVGAWAPSIQDRTSQPQLSEEQLKAKVVAGLKDPESAQFQGLQLVWTGRALCGQVNAKNSYGGYAGAKAFVADANGVYWAGDGSSRNDIGRMESRNTYYPKAHFWGC
jgi:hypothetical protein